MKWKNLTRCLAPASFLVIVLTAPLHAQAPFYQGKTLTIIVSSDAGGTSDLRVKSLVPYLQKYIPGNPTVVLEYMPGGGGRKAANHVYRTARPDGMVIGSMGTTLFRCDPVRVGSSVRFEQIYLSGLIRCHHAAYLFYPKNSG